MNLDRFLPLVFGLHCFAAMGGTADVFRVSQLSSSDLSESVSVKTLWGEVQRPSLPTHVCTVLPARLTPKHGSIDALDANPKVSKPDTKRLQDAIDDCPAGSAVKLVIDSHRKSGFLSGPLHLKSGVTLWIDEGVTLFASRNPKDYDKGNGTCGTATSTHEFSCMPLISAINTTGSGIVGGGVIDGRGGSILTGGKHARQRTWWDLAYQNKRHALHQQVPRLIQIRGGNDFTLYRVAIENAPNFHVVADTVSGVTVWGIRILTPSLVYTTPGYHCPPGTTPDVVTPATCFTPDTVKNTDGFDPGQSNHVLLAYSYISTGDDHVAIKARGKMPSYALSFLHNHFGYGHGMSIGSDIESGVHDMEVSDLSIDGFDSPNSNGLHMKSDADHGGVVDHVTYSKICMRRLKRPLAFDTFYKPSNGNSYPLFKNIVLQDIHVLESPVFGAGQLLFMGILGSGNNLPMTLSLDNVVFDGFLPTLIAPPSSVVFANPQAVHFHFGPGPVSFAPLITSSVAYDVTVSGSPSVGNPYDCSAAFINFSSVFPDSPI
ncbi:polygalacturonase [Xylella fastidiosa]|nr:glycosyl hydrolase family 28 protein [Xylella fastidiosa]MDD0929585.1 polygalacturonase [Xylella fastidiosa subsp. multiplex]MDD0942984.1 polygalacturonase [Xylella fastidiosa subsp. multiplex]QTX27419.1 polygalacturonase [Xylella fastidiosa subsp. multiplex]QTX29409.1 polygalacturonase [Xylella fastidiosa subsp. multiplex]TNV89790.1 polygalacturonase [Xylella fastidiosa]